MPVNYNISWLLTAVLLHSKQKDKQSRVHSTKERKQPGLAKVTCR